MKIWNCIKVPGMEIDEGAQTSAPSSVDNAGADVETVETPPTNQGPFAFIEATIGGNYGEMLNQAFGYHPTAEPVDESASEVECAEDSTPNTATEESSKTQYVSADEVDYSSYDVEVSETDFSEYKGDADEISINVPEMEFDNPVSEVHVETDEDVDNALEGPCESTIDTSSILNNILNNSESVPVEVEEPVNERVIEDEDPIGKPHNYALDDWKVNHIINAIDNYRREFFPNLPARPGISKKFLYNIPKYVFDAHQAATDKYDEHPVFDPAFWMVPMFSLLTELHKDPGYAMGEFLHRVCVIVDNDPTLQNEIDAKSEVYMSMLNSDDEDDNTEEVEEPAENNESDETNE